MNGYVDSLTVNMENSRNCLRRIARHDETEFSNQSILNVMEKFVKSVSVMDETILVPCRLMDLKVGDAQDTIDASIKCTNTDGKRNNTNVKNALCSADLFDLFNMLNSVKVDLLWGQNNGGEEPAADKSATLNVPSAASFTSISSGKGHVRRPSTVSVTSTNSVASVISDTESEAGNENDSGIEVEDSSSENTNVNPTIAVAQNFRRHLNGLYHSLQQLTNAANYLTLRYQHDVGTSV